MHSQLKYAENILQTDDFNRFLAIESVKFCKISNWRFSVIFLYKILAYCHENNLSEAAFEKGAGLSKGQINSWKNGSKPRISSLEKAAIFMGISLTELLDEEDGGFEPYDPTVSIPLSGTSEYIRVLADDIPENASCFALIMPDDSMLPEFGKGDLVIAQSCSSASTGDVVTVHIPGENMICRKIIYTDEGLILQPYNQLYDAEYYYSADIDILPIFVTGRVIKLIRSYNK